MPPSESMKLPIDLREWLIERYSEQRNKEEEAMEAVRKKSKSR